MTSKAAVNPRPIRRPLRRWPPPGRPGELDTVLADLGYATDYLIDSGYVRGCGPHWGRFDHLKSEIKRFGGHTHDGHPDRTPRLTAHRISAGSDRRE
jgi:hypothetical protein